MTEGALIWDFDGTLAFRQGMWSGTILDILRWAFPGLEVTRDEVRPFIRDGFPWHRPEEVHPETADADLWWKNVQHILEKPFLAFGAEPGRASELAGLVRTEYCRPGSWSLYDDTEETLERLSAYGWKHYVLSNHVPELPEIAGSLGLDRLLEGVFSSALTGIEKPNREAFLSLLRMLPDSCAVVMIGDSMEADVLGARNLGIPAILVRKPARPGVLHSEDLAGTVPLIDGIPLTRIADIIGDRSGL